MSKWINRRDRREGLMPRLWRRFTDPLFILSTRVRGTRAEADVKSEDIPPKARESISDQLGRALHSPGYRILLAAICLELAIIISKT